MEDCLICYNKMKTGKTLPCQHKLCHSCYLRLDNCSCPFCRKNFTYSKKDLIKRDKLNIDNSECIIISLSECLGRASILIRQTCIDDGCIG